MEFIILSFKHPAVNMAELVVLVDEQNNQIGTMPKLEAHNANTPLHRGFSLFLFNPKGELLLQQRALTKKTWPGVWSNSCCGHPGPGESVEQAINRRLQHELGLSGIDYQLILSDYRYRFERDVIVENEICPVYIGQTDVSPKFNPDEVAAIRYIDWSDFLEIAETGDRAYSEWSLEESLLLSDNKKFQELWHSWYN
jgi:isopentenyl-diphosphate delta-isomerase